MNAKSSNRRFGRTLWINAAVLALSAVLVACGGGGSSSSSSGATGTVRGNLASFSAFNDGQEILLPATDQELFARLRGVAFPSAHAQAGGLSGINVTVGGRTATTNSSGGFQVNNVPAGQRQITFSGGGISGSTTVDVVAGATTVLVNVVVTGNRATPSSVSRVGGSSSNSNGSTGASSSNTSTTNTASDNTSNDDDDNDNLDDDDDDNDNSGDDDDDDDDDSDDD